jgi:hypothetical protein
MHFIHVTFYGEETREVLQGTRRDHVWRRQSTEAKKRGYIILAKHVMKRLHFGTASD